MKLCKFLFIFYLFINTTSGFFLPQIFGDWHPVAIYDNIDKSKHFSISYGKLPLVLFFNNTIPQIKINNSLNTFGTTIIKDGIIWWSYKSIKKIPPSFFRNNLKNIDNNSLRNIILDY